MKFSNLKLIEFVPDVLNIFIILFFIYFFVIRFKINIRFFFYLAFTLVLTVILNLSIHWSFLPDQTKYAQSIYNFRSYHYPELASQYFTLKISSFFLSLIPVPFVVSTLSVALINRAIISTLIIYFLKNKSCSFFLIYFLLFFPSIIFYSSFALREILILIISLIYFYFFIFKNRFFFSLILIFILSLIKPQLAILYICISFFYWFFFIININKIFKLLVILSTFFLIIFLNQIILISVLKIRQGFDLESFNYGSIKTNLNLFSELQNFSAFIRMLLNGLFTFLLSPLNQAITFSRIFLFIENLFLYILIILYLLNLFRVNKFKCYFWTIVLLLNAIIIGVIFSNDGTMWRYKFQLLITILFTTHFSCKKTPY